MTRSTVALFSALRPEIDLLLGELDGARAAVVGGWPIWVGELADRPVVLAQAGLGKANIAALAGVVWERHAPTTMIFTGVAGGLDPALGVGDVVVGERTIQHDWGVLGAAGLQRYQAGHIPFLNPTDEFGFTPSAALLGAVRRAVASTRLTPVLERSPLVAFGTIVTGDQFLQDATTRDRMFAELDAQAIEMEGAALAQVAAGLGVDHLVIRAVSDLAADEAPEHFARFVPAVAANSARLVRALLELDW